MVTPELKDVVLKTLTDSKSFNISFAPKQLANELNISVDLLVAILKYFERCGIIDSLQFTLGYADCIIVLTIEAYDLMRLGGFTGKEKVLQLEIEKLKEELNSLKKSNPTNAERMLEALSNITSVLTFFKAL
jgi:hypothetical protein